MPICKISFSFKVLRMAFYLCSKRRFLLLINYVWRQNERRNVYYRKPQFSTHHHSNNSPCVGLFNGCFKVLLNIMVLWISLTSDYMKNRIENNTAMPVSIVHVSRPCIRWKISSCYFSVVTIQSSLCRFVDLLYIKHWCASLRSREVNVLHLVNYSRFNILI